MRMNVVLIDADQNPKTGWEGYDLIVNRTMDGGAAWLEKNLGGWKWGKVAKVDLVTKGNELMLAVPCAALGVAAGDGGTLDFKWRVRLRQDSDTTGARSGGSCRR